MSRIREFVFRTIAPALLGLALVTDPTGAALATPGEIHVVKSSTANLRASPSKSARVIGRLVRGDRVMEFERRGRWLKVQQMGKVAPEGWVHGDLLAPQPAESSAQPVPQTPRHEEQAVPPARASASSTRVIVIGRHGHRHATPREKWLARLLRPGRAHHHKVRRKGGKFRHDHKNSRIHRYRQHGQPHGAARGERGLSGPHLRSQPAGG